MSEKKKKKTTSGNEDSRKKERHIVTWTQEEDDILREQISIHGTDNWSIIASKFKDKTTRQCRRRWYTYLNSDFKKGGWSPEEDMLLCEAQKIFGNRWTEISKVVSGRTDNAVKNRFTTLCKKRAKYEALAKENAASVINSNNKRVYFQNGINTSETSETVAPIKKIRRSHIPAISETCNFGERLYKLCGNTVYQHQRPPTVISPQNFRVNILPEQTLVSRTKELPDEVKCNKTQKTFLKKDDPKMIALMQQAQLLSSIAQEVNAENTDQSFQNAWKVIEEFLDQNKQGSVLQYQTPNFDFQLENFKEIMEDLKSSEEESQFSWRQPNLYESPSSSDYSTGSTILQHAVVNRKEQTQSEISNMHQGVVTETEITQFEERKVSEYESEILSIIRNQDVLPTFDEQRENDGPSSVSSSAEFNSPLQVTPLFRSLAAGIPSPHFSESERHFLMKTLGMESPSANTSSNPLPSPPCKRVLLRSL